MGKDAKGNIYLSQEEYDNFVSETIALREKVQTITNAMTEDFERLQRELYQINHDIAKRMDTLSRFIVQDKNVENGVVEVNDYVTVDLMFEGDEPEEMIFKLVIDNPNPKAKVEEVSIDSPLGKSVYKKQIGEKTNYSINNNLVNVLIKDSVKEMGKVKTLGKMD